MHASLRKLVEDRAGRRCEYYRLSHHFQPLSPFHVEHIIARQHGGTDSPENLALASHRCNLHKGPNLTGLDPETGALTRLYHPRQDHWTKHFELHVALIIGLTAIGRTTAALCRMNTPDRIELRRDLLATGWWE
jgi:5-methylcytosine-specific restriction endonuclease McrA